MITLRKIEEQDLEKIMNWRMRPDITKWMNTDPVLTLEGQKKWYEQIQTSKDSRYWMIVIDGIDSGIISIVDLDEINKTVSWGYYIAENEKRSLKNAVSLEMSLYQYLFEVLGLECIYNEALSINKGVIQLHKMCGNHVVEEKKELVEKNQKKYDVTVMEITKTIWEKWEGKPDYEKIDFNTDKKIHHIGYLVNSIEKAEQTFFVLGYRKENDVIYDESRGINILFMKHQLEPHTRIELIQGIDEKNAVSAIQKRFNNMPSPYHICYEVKNLSYAIEMLTEKGFQKMGKESPAPAINNRSVCFLYKSDVGMIELVEAE